MRTTLILILILFSIIGCKPVALKSSVCTEIKVKYIEMYGSVCCPRDYKQDNHLLNYIRDFENKYHVKLECNYKLQLGREGEAAYFLSFENLSTELQEKFISGREKILKSNDKSVINYMENPVPIKEALKMWEQTSINNLIKF